MVQAISTIAQKPASSSLFTLHFSLKQWLTTTNLEKSVKTWPKNIY